MTSLYPNTNDGSLAIMQTAYHQTSHPFQFSTNSITSARISLITLTVWCIAGRTIRGCTSIAFWIIGDAHFSFLIKAQYLYKHTDDMPSLCQVYLGRSLSEFRYSACRRPICIFSWVAQLERCNNKVARSGTEALEIVYICWLRSCDFCPGSTNSSLVVSPSDSLWSMTRAGQQHGTIENL